MDVTKLFVSQRKLRQPEQVASLVAAIREYGHVPPIRLSEAEDGTVQFEDGHHRLVAYWLSGRTRLEPHEYVLVLREPVAAPLRTGRRPGEAGGPIPILMAVAQAMPSRTAQQGACFNGLGGDDSTPDGHGGQRGRA
jgi:hypothetical protein